ncbi:MAG: transposase, partial [Planctomycetota bacterium]|nr:transposase [Planctomycetota bacterium]
RVKEYDYSQAGGYFITICAYGKEKLFVEEPIKNIIEQVWDKLPERFTQIEVDQFVIMPNHIHGIIVVGAVHEPPTEAIRKLGTIRELPLRQKRRQMLLPQIIGYFKMNTAKLINENRKTQGFSVWQRNYYEHIIRDEPELNRVREYIINNPIKWEFDRENPDRISNKQYEQIWKWLEG